eukprot:1135299-Alexandrium_andersonii.AAC.1
MAGWAGPLGRRQARVGPGPRWARNGAGRACADQAEEDPGEVVGQAQGQGHGRWQRRRRRRPEDPGPERRRFLHQLLPGKLQGGARV